MKIISQGEATEREVPVLDGLSLKSKSRVTIEYGERKETLRKVPVMFLMNKE